MLRETLLGAASAAHLPDGVGSVGNKRTIPRSLGGTRIALEIDCGLETHDPEVDAMATAAGQTKDGLSFGPFNLVASERLLTKEGAPWSWERAPSKS